jgi:TetR/AcrR family transcriptional regulator
MSMSSLGDVAIRRERNAEETRRKLLVAAEIEFAAKGFDGARLGNIARAVGVQQAMIHHYFADKRGLYLAVVEHGLAAMAEEGWSILGAATEFASLVEDFVDLLVRFYATHEALLSILRHDAQSSDEGGGETLRELFEQVLRPVFDAVVARLLALQKKGLVRKDLDPRHLCLSAMGMAFFPFQEERLLRALWPADFRAAEMIDARKREIVETLIARGRP